MDVFSVLESREEILILREECEYSDLHLRVIRYQEDISW